MNKKRIGILCLIFLILLPIAAVISMTLPQARTTLNKLALTIAPTPVNISQSTADSDWPLLGVDQNGAAYAVWFEHLSRRNFYFSTNRSGQWSTPQWAEQLNWDSEESGWPWMAVSRTGVCHLTFHDIRTGSYDIIHRIYENGWGAVTNVSNTSEGSAYCGCAVNPVDNYGYVVWMDGTNPEWRWYILLRYRSTSGSWSSNQVLTSLGDGYMPKIAIDNNGTAHLTWSSYHGRNVLYSKNSTPQNPNTWTEPILVKGDVGLEWGYCTIACDDAGNAYIIWMDGTYGNEEIILRKVYSNGTLSPEFNLSQSQANSEEHSIAVGGNTGNILVAWRENNDIYINAFIGGIWTGPQNVSQSPAISKMPWVAVDRSGGGHLVYSEYINGNFEILYMAILSGIYVTSPNGGEVWPANSSRNITWQSTGVPGNVKIEYSTNNGSSYTTVAASTENDGTYSWTIPNTPSTQCRVRVSEATTGTPSDTSDAVFTITEPVPCTYSISPSSKSFSALGGRGSINVTTQSGCAWTAVSNVGWVIIDSGSSGNGSGQVVYTVASNSTASSRSGTITVAGKTFTINQEAPLSGTAFIIPFGSLDNGNVNIANIGATIASGKLRVFSTAGINLQDFDFSIPVNGVKRTWDIAGNIYSYGKPLAVEVTSDQTLVGDNIKWANAPYDSLGAGFTCGPLNQAKGRLFYFPFSSFTWASGYAVIANTATTAANVTIEVYDRSGVLKKTSNFTVSARGVVRSWDYIGSIQNIADPALLKISSDQDIVVEAVRWEENKRGWGFAIFPSSLGGGTSFLVPFGSLDNGNINLANIGSSSASATIRVRNASGVTQKEISGTIPVRGVVRTWDVIGNIYAYGKPVTVEVTSNQPLVCDNIKWANPPYDTVGAGFTCGPLTQMKGRLMYFPFSSFGQSNSYAIIANTMTTAANITIEVYDQSGILKKTSSFTLGGRGIVRSWDYIGSIQTYADPALIKISSDQDIVVEAVRLEQNKRGWGFAVLPIN